MLSSPKTWRLDLSAHARQANHVLATAVVVFTGAILLGRLTEPWMLSWARWLGDHMSASVVALLFGPFIVDLPKVTLILLVAFPLGRVSAPRSWPAAVGLTLLVYGFDFGVDYVLGAHRVTWFQWQAAVGRGLLAALTTLVVATLVARGRRAAELADGKGAALEPGDADSRDSDHEDAQEDGSQDVSAPQERLPCKRKRSIGVGKGEP